MKKFWVYPAGHTENGGMVVVPDDPQEFVRRMLGWNNPTAVLQWIAVKNEGGRQVWINPAHVSAFGELP